MLHYGLTWRPRTDNLGDDLTSLAAMALLPRVDHVLDADALDEPLPLPAGDRLALLINGLMLRSTAQWPPAAPIVPVCAGVHISGEDEWGLPLATLDETGLAALQACAPIAARDLRTATRLEQLGIAHAVTGCLTLTLQHPTCRNRSGIVCCDVPQEVLDVTRSLRPDVTCVTHRLEAPSPDFSARMDAARAMLEVYATAEMVFTRRLHCAMACLAVGTPVLLLYHDEYEDVARFAPMDGMVRHQPVTGFLHETRLHGLPAPWRNPADMGPVQRRLIAAVQEGLQRASTCSMPLVPPQEANAWRTARIRRILDSASSRITALENQHVEDLKAKFLLLDKEDNVKTLLSALLTMPEVLEALRTASMRQHLIALGPRDQKALAAEYRRGAADTDDLIRQAMSALDQLGWPEGGE